MTKGGLFGLAALIVLAACSNPETILPGERFGIRGETAVPVNRAVPIRLSPMVNRNSWTQRAGSASHRVQHPAFSASPAQIWAADIGQGNDRRHRITADPVAADGRIFTLDSRATVAATSVTGGRLWSRDLTPPSENADDASGGGLAVVNGQLYVTTGFGDLFALNAADGSLLWQQRLRAPATGAPTVGSGLVYLSTRNNDAWAIDARNGRVRWQLDSPPSVTGIVNGAAPAIGNGLVIFPYGSAQIAGAFPKGGLQVWNASVAGSRPGTAYAQLSDVSADPVVQGSRVYVGNPSGRFLAVDAANGDTIWSVNDGATGPAWVDGGSVFLVSDRAELIRLQSSNGDRIWGVRLPNFVPTRGNRPQRDIYANYGPVLAGGLLWVASGDGTLRGFDPVDGRQAASTPVPGGAATRPIVMDGVMYMVSADGQLLAFR